MVTKININGVTKVGTKVFDSYPVNTEDRFIEVEHSFLSSEEVANVLGHLTKYPVMAVKSSMVPKDQRKRMSLERAIAYVSKFRFKRLAKVSRKKPILIDKVDELGLFAKYTYELQYRDMYDVTFIHIKDGVNVDLSDIVRHFEGYSVKIASNSCPYVKGHFEMVFLHGLYSLRKITREVKAITEERTSLVEDNFDEL